MVRITVKTNNGDLSNGSAFHIGDGWLVTAAHVVKDLEIVEIVTEYLEKDLNIEKIIFHPDEEIDIAIIKTDFELNHYLTQTSISGVPDGFIKTDHIEIGGHLDDWIGDELVMSKVLLMGYPPVPFSDKISLIASKGEVNTVIDKYNGSHPHFIISSMARGGYSGGPVVSEHGFLLGILIESLVSGHEPEEIGFTSAISVEPLLHILKNIKIYPGNNEKLIKMLP